MELSVSWLAKFVNPALCRSCIAVSMGHVSCRWERAQLTVHTEESHRSFTPLVLILGCNLGSLRELKKKTLMSDVLFNWALLHSGHGDVLKLPQVILICRHFRNL